MNSYPMFSVMLYYFHVLLFLHYCTFPLTLHYVSVFVFVFVWCLQLACLVSYTIVIVPL